MTKQSDAPKQVCERHGVELVYIEPTDTWSCPTCLKNAYLSMQAQKESEQRYRKSEKGKQAIKRYEESEKGRKARNRYLKSPKYKERRKEYNQKLAESLRIARRALTDYATSEKPVEKLRSETHMPIIQDIREYVDIMGSYPTPEEIVEWATDSYNVSMTKELAQILIDKAKKK